MLENTVGNSADSTVNNMFGYKSAAVFAITFTSLVDSSRQHVDNSGEARVCRLRVFHGVL